VADDDGPGRPCSVVIPTSVAEVTPAWLTQVLAPREAPAAPSASAAGVPPQVVGVRTRTVGVGLGLLGRLHRLDLDWVGDAGPTRLVVKLPAAGTQSRSVATALDMYRNEVRFYRTLAEGTEVAVDCHHAAVDERTHDFVLVLDDRSPDLVFDQLGGCTPARAATVVTQLADHHARYWDEEGLSGSPWLRRLSDPALVDQFVAALRVTWPLIRRRFADELEAPVVTLGDRLGDMVPHLAATLSRPPCTLSHGDVRLDNMFFGPDRLRLCDWQLADRSRGPRDLAYFLTQSLTPAVRAECEGALVQLYLDRLAHRGVEGYGADQAWDDYRAATLFGFVYAVIAGGGLDQDDARSAALTHTMLERSAAAMVDHDCASLG
jgi:hypothetical protein